MISKFCRLLVVVITIASISHQANADVAIFGMGCFWSGESAFRSSDNNGKLPGITDISVGYMGGKPTPGQKTPNVYREVIRIEYNPIVIFYDELLDLFWHNIDPFDANGQFCDKGPAYTTAIYFNTPEQQKMANDSKAALEDKFSKDITTLVIPETTFYAADEDNQDYKVKHPVKYLIYRLRCSRDSKLQEIWGNTKKSSTPEDF